MWYLIGSSTATSRGITGRAPLTRNDPTFAAQHDECGLVLSAAARSDWLHSPLVRETSCAPPEQAHADADQGEQETHPGDGCDRGTGLTERVSAGVG